MKHIRTLLLVALLLLTMFLGVLFIYSKYFEKPSLSYAPMPFPITAKVVYPGGVATATATRCNTSNSTLVYASTRLLKRENSNQPALVLESVVITIAPGCSTVSTRINVLPEETPPGFYRFSGVAIVKGLLVEHTVPWNTDVFEVIEKPVKDTP